MSRPAAILVAVGAGLALADGSIVVLALPELLGALDTTVTGVAAVIGVYTAALAVALMLAELARRRLGARRLAAAGLTVFGLASLVCGLAGSLPVMLVMRGVQAAGGAGALVGAFGLLDAAHRRGGAGRLWTLSAIAGAAAGPALGGALTQAFSWRAIFLAQVPVVLAAALAAARGPDAAAADPAAPAPSRTPAQRCRAAAALAAVSAALTAVLFVLVLMLVAGWGEEPLAGAAALTVLPLAALASLRAGGDPVRRAVAGSLLVAGGVAALATIGTASAWWTVPPQLLAGAGMGLALPALAGDLLPERTPAEAARVLTVRHAGIAVALAVLAPLIANRLDAAIQRGREREVAVLLDARLSPAKKIALVGPLLGRVDERNPRGDLRSAFSRAEADASGSDRAELQRAARRADETITIAVREAFGPAFLVTAAFALLAAAMLAPDLTAPRRLLSPALAALAVPAVMLAIGLAVRPSPVELRDPCQGRDLPGAGGLFGLAQDFALRQLDRVACRLGATREELVLALADERDARRFEREHGVNPRSITSFLRALVP